MAGTLTLPRGYRAYLLGSVSTIEGLEQVEAAEASAPEGSYMLMRLTFEEMPSDEVVAQLNQELADAGVTLWPNHTQHAFAEPDEPVVYLAWVKGITFMPIIIGILVVLILPLLLGGLVWMLLPETIKNIIELVIVMVVMVMMMKVMGSSLEEPAPEQTKYLEKGEGV